MKLFEHDQYAHIVEFLENSIFGKPLTFSELFRLHSGTHEEFKLILSHDDIEIRRLR